MATWLLVYIAMSLCTSAFVLGLGYARAARRPLPAPVPLQGHQAPVLPRRRSVA